MTAHRARALAALLLAQAPLGGCYLLSSAAGQLDLNSRRVPIHELVADPETAPALKAELETALRIRAFGSRSLGLPDNGSYKSYADVGRRYVVWNVFAAPELSVEPKTWCFPWVGCVSYRGYFDAVKAQGYAYKLKRQGYDVLVAGVAAYSTLGHFDDPVLSTMLGWDDAELAAIIFHELAHQLVYVEGDSAFNEAFATTVERAGVRRWLESTGKSGDLSGFTARAHQTEAVAALVAASRERLKALFRGGGDVPTLRAGKAAEFARLRESYAVLVRAGGPAGYAWLFGADMNNASLLAVATYYDCVPGFEQRLASVDEDLPRFYALVRALAATPFAERHRSVCGA